MLDLAFLHWQKRTLRRLWQRGAQGQIWRRHRPNRTKVVVGNPHERTLLGTIEDTVTKSVSEVQRLGKKIAKTCGPQEIKCLAPRMGACLKVVTDSLLPFLNSVREAPDAEQAFDKAAILV